MAKKRVSYQNKPKDVASKRGMDKKLTEDISATNEVGRDDGQKRNRGRPKASKISDNKEKSVSIGSDRALRWRNATNEEGSVDEKAKGKKPTEVNEEAKGNKTTAKDAGAGKSEKAGKRKVIAKEENAEKAGTPMKRRRSTDKNEKETSDLVRSTRALRPRNARKVAEIIDEKAKVKKPVADKSGTTDVEVARIESGAKVKIAAEGGIAVKTKTPVKSRNADKAQASSSNKGSYKLRSRRGPISEHKPNAGKKEKDLNRGSADAGSLNENLPKAGDPEPTRKVASRAVKKGHADGTQKREDNSDEFKDVRGISLKKDVKQMANKNGKKRGVQSQKRENAEENKTGELVIRKMVSNRVSDAETQPQQKTKKGGGQGNVESRRNPDRKGRANAETK